MSAKVTPLYPKRVRVLFLAGRLPKRARPCSRSWHAGPLRSDPDALFRDTGECVGCGMLVHRSQVRVPA
jgi:hypothetical protein